MKRGKGLNRISPRKVQALIDSGQSIPADSFQVAKKLLKGKRKPRSRKTYYKGVLHGSRVQVLVYQNFELLQMAGEYAELEAEKDFVLNAEGGGQIGLHIVDIFGLNVAKNWYESIHVKADYEGSIDALSKWKKKHLERQYPTINGLPHKSYFYIADEYGGRVFRKESEILEALGQ